MHHGGTALIDPYAIWERAGAQPGWHVADLGCGTFGHFVFPAAKIVGGEGKVYAIDTEPSHVHTVSRLAKAEQQWNVYPMLMDHVSAHIPEASLDATLIANNVFLSRERDALVREAFRLTRPGGLILVIEWKKEHTPLGPPIEHRLSPEQAQSFFRLPDLHFHDLFDAGDHHYALIHRRAESNPTTQILSFHQPLE